jgi:hypothetical protein
MEDDNAHTHTARSIYDTGLLLVVEWMVYNWTIDRTMLRSLASKSSSAAAALLGSKRSPVDEASTQYEQAQHFGKANSSFIRHPLRLIV